MRITVMSDLHLSRKPWQVRKALNMGAEADLVLLVGDLVNDGTPAQLERMRQCIHEVLPDTPVLAVAGNHDYPHTPSPMVREGICDYPALQDWLLQRQKYPYILDASGAWAVDAGHAEILGLNCVSHWRRFKFKDGDQLTWLRDRLETGSAPWRIVLCHAPLLAHNPKRSDTKPYLSRDGQLQQILDAHRNIMFLSGHTHVSMESPVSCVEWDGRNNHLYLNDGSVRPTTVLQADGKPTAEPADGTVVELLLLDHGVTVTARSVRTGEQLFQKTCVKSEE